MLVQLVGSQLIPLISPKHLTIYLGSTFGTSSAPLINRVLQDTLSLVLSPNQTIPGQTVYDLWSKKISTIGSGSDYTAFQDFAGVPSVDMGFHTAKPGPVYHYHSNYDSFYWMDTYGDPGWVYHTTIAKVWALLMAKFVEAPIIPFNATDYATAFKGYVKSIEKQVKKAAAANEIAAAEAGAWSLSEFDEPVEAFYNAAVALDAEGAALTEQLTLHPSVNRGSSFSLETALHKNITKVNDKYKFLERQFLYAPGLDKRSWFKHVVYAPGRWTGYAGAVFPGLVESVEDDDKENFEKWKKVIVERVKAAVALLEDEKIGSIKREEEL
jgi:N-acetylated-alpha-linked acidic dipeptidase